MEKVILRRKQVAEALGISVCTLWRWQKAGRFPRAVRLGCNSVGFVRSEVEAWIEAQKGDRP